MDLQQQQVAILSALGAALMTAQVLEKQLALLLNVKAPSGLPVTINAIQAQPRHARKKTLGQLFDNLKQGDVLVPELVADLDSFLEERNKLAHRFSSLGSWDLNSVEGCSAAQAYLLDFIRRANQLNYVFGGALNALEYHFKIVQQMPAFSSWSEEMSLSYEPMLSAWRRHLTGRRDR